MNTFLVTISLLIALFPNMSIKTATQSQIVDDDIGRTISENHCNDDEYYDYCIKNGVYSMNAPDENTTDKLLEEDVAEHLNGRFPSYNNWTQIANGTNSVASKYGGEPIEVDESDSDIQEAKILAGIDRISIGSLSVFYQ